MDPAAGRIFYYRREQDYAEDVISILHSHIHISAHPHIHSSAHSHIHTSHIQKFSYNKNATITGCIFSYPACSPLYYAVCPPSTLSVVPVI
jgi:hypothetical protein